MAEASGRSAAASPKLAPGAATSRKGLGGPSNKRHDNEAQAPRAQVYPVIVTRGKISAQ